MSGSPFLYGCKIAGTGSYVPEKILTNDDLAKMMDTSDEWIQQRTGIRERRICAPDENNITLSRDALKDALDNANITADNLDLIIIGSCTQEMNVPSTACRVAAEFGLSSAGAFDLIAACSGFVYAMNVADSLIRTGRYKTIGVVGCDALSKIVDYSERSVSILFGDAAGAAVLTRDDNVDRGCVYQTLSADGTGWDSLYAPRKPEHIREWDQDNPIELGCLRMQGREVYKFAVTTFQQVIEDALAQTNLAVDDISQFICHQSNARIIESAKQKLGLPDDKVHINIDRFGNASAGSAALCLDQLNKAGKIHQDDWIVMVAFGAGLTWASNVWKV